jgi:hypothetical protein
VPTCFRHSLLAACAISLLTVGCRSDSTDQTHSMSADFVQEFLHNPFTPKPEPASPTKVTHARISDASPFVDYDEPLVTLIEKNWSQIINDDTHLWTADKGGWVVTTFQLHSDGTVSDIKVTKSTVGPEYVSACEKAISKSFPYKPWSEEMRKKSQKESGRDVRDITFKFYYDVGP